MPAPVLQFKRGNAGVAGTVPALRPGEPAISLNNFDFFIGIDTSVANNKFFGSHRYWGREDGTNALRLKLVDKGGTNSINIKAPDTITGTGGTYTLPDVSTITPGYFLKVGAGGTLAWDSVASVTGGTLSNTSLTGVTTISGTSLTVSTTSVQFTGTTDNTLGNTNSGAVQIDGGLGVDKNVSVGAGLSVTGQSFFIGTATFYGGSIQLGDQTSDAIVVGGRFASDLIPTTDNAYDLGNSTLNWRHAIFSGIGTFETGAVVDAVQIGIAAANEIDTSSGNLILDSAGGTLDVQDNLTVSGITTLTGNLFANGNVTLGDAAGDTITINGTATFTQGLTGSISTATRARTVDILSAPNGVYYPALLNTTTNGVTTSIFADSGIFYVAQTDTLYVNGNVSIGGTSGVLFTTNLFVNDKDIVVGYTTDINGNESSTDVTSTHGGISVASTTGSPLFNMPIVAGVNSLPFTYKQFMWIAAATNGYSGMGTDSWVSNYPIAIGTATVQNQSRFTVGAGFTFYDNLQDARSVDLRIRHINAGTVGVITAFSFVGSLTGNASSATYATSAGIASALTASASVNTTGIITASSFVGSLTGGATYATSSGIASALTSTASVNTTGIITASSFVGSLTGNASSATYATSSGIASALTSTASVNTTGIITASSFVGSLTGNASSATYATSAGIASALTSTASVNTTGIITASSFVGSLTGNASSATYATSSGIASALTASASVNTTGIITASSFVGSLTGNASSATYATSAGIASALTSTASVNTTGIITASSFVGPLTGTASTASRAIGLDVVGVATNQNYNIALFDGSGNAKNAGVDAELLYNPNTNVLSVPQIKIGTGAGVTQFSSAVSAGASTSSVPTSSAVIDYVATQVGNVDLTTGLNADSGGPSTFNTSQTLTISGTTNQVQTAVSGQTVTVSLPNTVVVGTSVSAPTLKAGTIQSQTGTNAITIANNGAVTTLNSLTVTGDLFVNGNTTEVNTTSLTVYDRTITLGLQTGATPTTTTWDLGILMNYGDAGVAKTAGVVWDYATRRFRFGIDTDNPPSTGTTTPQIGITTYAAIEVAGLWINNACSGGVQEVIGCNGSELQLQNIIVDGGAF